MNVIKLKVTPKVLEHVANVGHSSQKQIAYEIVDGDLYKQNSMINKHNKVTIRVASQVMLTVGDTSAIWLSHQKQQEPFNTLYDLLSLNAGQSHSFPYELES